MDDIKKLIEAEGWSLVQDKESESQKVLAYGQLFEVRHPVQIALRLYRTETNPDQKYLFMEKAHDYLWPKTVWHYWTERRFREHCEDWNYIVLAAGASSSKSFDTAKIGCLFWLANPTKRGVIIASTTLESLTNRIWGYAMRFLSKMAIKLPFQYLGGNTPKVLYPSSRSDTEIRDTIHGMFAVAAKSGDDERTISSWIGRHPEDALMLILDEATDMPGSIVKSFANLDTGGKPFQCIAIGNSNSTDDLHGALATPEAGWPSIDPMKDSKWLTTQKKGVCLFFSCYDSPAIHEPDAEKKKLLGKFLITEEQIEIKKVELGEDSDAFYRFVMGFWRHQSTESTIVSKAFLDNFGVSRKTEWGGIHPLRIIGGLDPAFSTGGDQCMLRLAILGVDVTGLYILDFRGAELTFVIPILRTDSDSADIQIGKKVQKILDSYNCPLECVAIDATGQGRALGGLLQLQMKSLKNPIRIYSSKTGVNQENAFDVIVKSTYDLWFDLRTFIQNNQIRGLDELTMIQLSQRQVERLKSGKLVLESKADYKRRMGAKYPSLAHSPDHADAAALAVQSAILNFGFSLGKRRNVEVTENFDQLKYFVYQQERKEAEAQKKQFVQPRVNFRGSLEDIRRKTF